MVGSGRKFAAAAQDKGQIELGNPTPSVGLGQVPPLCPGACPGLTVFFEKIYAPPCLYAGIIYCQSTQEVRLVRFNSAH